MSTNYERAFASHPAVYEAWSELNAAVKADMDPRRYELVTLAAALALRSSYCSLAHGVVLSERFDEPVAAIVNDRANAGLSDADIASMELAERVATDATSVTPGLRQRMRESGLSDREIELVVLAAAARCFFSKSLDGLGAAPDPSFRTLDPELKEALVVGAAIEGEDVSDLAV